MQHPDPPTAAPQSPPAIATPVHSSAHRWDRAAVVALGLAGFVLSFDALRQMAAAAHVRPALTWLFPLIVDGFIAYSVRALIVLRHAPLAARAYVWTLFATATAASIWANVLHAVVLNQRIPPDAAAGIQLSNNVVGVLSALAPLALAAAVHLHTLIGRRPAPSGTAPTRASSVRTAKTFTVACADIGPNFGRPPEPERPADPARESVGSAPRQTGKPESVPVAPANAVRSRDAARPTIVRIASSAEPSPRRGRRPTADLDTLTAIGRAAATTHGKLTRDVVQTAIRAQGLHVGADRLAEVMRRLKEPADHAAHPEPGLGRVGRITD